MARFPFPRGKLWPEQERLTFESGKCSLHVRRGAVDIQSLRLLGPGHCLRAQGTILFSGEADLVLFLIEAPGHMALSSLSDQSTPADWKAVAERGFRSFRVSGTLMQPRIREVGPADAAFLPTS